MTANPYSAFVSAVKALEAYAATVTDPETGYLRARAGQDVADFAEALEPVRRFVAHGLD